MTGGDKARRFYEQFIEHFLPLRGDVALIGEWVSLDAVAQEYDIWLDVAGEREHHRVLGVLYRDGRLLGGERVYGSEAFVRRMTGALFDELEPIG